MSSKPSPRVSVRIDFGPESASGRDAPVADAATEDLTNPVCIRDFELWASRNTPYATWAYWSAVALDGVTYRLNLSAFDALRILPRVMRDVSRIDTRTRPIFGRYVFSNPIGISPTSEMKLAHEDGERGAARAAARRGVPQIMSTMTTMGFEEVAGGAREVLGDFRGSHGEVPTCWFQLYLGKDWEDTARLIKGAEEAGYAAVVVTVDFPKWGRRLHALREPFVMPEGMTHALKAAPAKVLPGRATDDDSLAASKEVSLLETMTWERDIPMLRKITKLPIVLKGIMHPADAVKAMEVGVEGIVVSNHGARQLDTVPATIEALPHIVHALRTRVKSSGLLQPHVFLDGGIRRGTDVFKALAFGAELVFLGRPSLWSLRWGGEAGVSKMLELLDEELRNAMALAGLARLEEVDEMCVVWEHEIRARPGRGPLSPGL